MPEADETDPARPEISGVQATPGGEGERREDLPDSQASGGGEGAFSPPISQVGGDGSREDSSQADKGAFGRINGDEGEEGIEGEDGEGNPPDSPSDGAGEVDSPAARDAKRITRDEFRAAVIAGDGNIDQVAYALGLKPASVRQRIATDSELNLLYGPESRKLNNISVVDTITKTDLQAYRAALKVYGISERHLEKLEALDKLASDGGRLLMVSFRVTHQSYVGQLHNLDEIADDIKMRLKGLPDANGNVVPLKDEDYSKLAKVYVECIKERGKGFQLMTLGMETINRMMRQAKEEAEGKKGRRVKPGWGEMKKVRPMEGDPNGAPQE